MSLNEKLVPKNTLLTDLKEFPIKLVELSSLTSADLERHVKEITELNMDVFVFVYDAEIRIKPLEEIDDGVWEEADRLAMLQNTKTPNDLDHAPFTGFVKLPKHEIAVLKKNYTTELSRIWLDTDLQNFGKLTSPITIHRHDLFIMPSDLTLLPNSPMTTFSGGTLRAIGELTNIADKYAPGEGIKKLPTYIDDLVDQITALTKDNNKLTSLLSDPNASRKTTYENIIGGLIVFFVDDDENAFKKKVARLRKSTGTFHLDTLKQEIYDIVASAKKGPFNSTGWQTILTSSLTVAGFNKKGKPLTEAEAKAAAEAAKAALEAEKASKKAATKT